MNLDDHKSFSIFDTQDMISEIDGLPDQLWNAWELSKKLENLNFSGIRQVVIAGMGGSAIGADLLAAYIAPVSNIPVIIHRDYDLPAWANGGETLVIASSHSGNTEETLSSFEQAKANNCQLMVISTGGELVKQARQARAVTWQFDHKGQPRAAVGFSFGLLLGAFFRMGLIANPESELASAVDSMQKQANILKPGVQVNQNPAKRLAGQLMGRLVVIIGAERLGVVARRWKGQMSEVAKNWGQFEFLPEANHNTLAGVINPKENLSRLMVIFLRAPSSHARNRLRTELTRMTFMLEGIGTDFVDAQGETTLAHMWTLLHFGDYTAYYLAMAYGVDPTPVEAIENFKQQLMSNKV